MWDTTVTVTRNGATVATGLRVQVQQESDQAIMSGFRDLKRLTNAYKLITLDWNPTALVQQDDALLDERYTDPDTTKAYRYKVTGRPKTYQSFHQEIHCEVVPGA